jgi:hypothetical protein
MANLDPNIILQAGRVKDIDPGALFQQAGSIKLGRLAALRGTQTQQALDRVRNNPEDPDAITQLAALDPAAGNAYLASQASKRAGETRSASADLIRSMPSIGSQPAQPSPAVAQLAPTSPAMVAAGQAVAGGMSPTEAAARVVQSGGADALNEVIKSWNGLDDVRKGKLQEGNAAAGQAALSLLNVPQAQRAAALQQLAPGLAQHYITPDKLGDLSDTTLHGIVGQATTVAEGIKQADDDRKYGLEVRKQGETERHNQAEENKPITAQFGSALVNPRTGAVVYGGDSAGGGGDVNSKIAALEGTTPNPRSSANGPGQFINSTFRQYIGGASPEIASKIAGMSDAQLTAFRAANASTLAPIQTQMLSNLTTANQQALSSAGVPVTDANTYLAHVFGAGGAAQALKANPNTPAAAYLGGGKALTNNGLPGNATVAQVQAWADRKMQGAGGGGGGGLSADTIKTQAALGIKEYGGQVPPGYAKNRAAQAAIANEITKQIGGVGGVDGAIASKQDYGSQTAAIKTWNSGKPNTGAAQTRSIGVAVDHIDQLSKAAQALNNGNTPIFNQVAQAYAKQTGKAAPTNFSAVKDFVLDEVTKAIIGAGGGVGDREKAAQIVSNWQSPAQSAGAIKQLHSLMAGQLHGLESQYEQTTGRQDFQRYVSPRAAKVLGLAPQQRMTGTLSAPSQHPSDIQAILQKYK